MLRNKQNDKDMSSNKKIPQLRFPGFTDEWEEKKINEMADVLQGYGFPDKYQGQKNGDLPFCKVGDISAAVDKGEQAILRAANYVDYSLLSTLHAKPIPVGATVFAKIGEAIRTNKKIRTAVPCLIDNNTAAVKAKNNEIDDFMFYLMSKINLADYSGGIVPSVNKSTIESISVCVPVTIAEQNKISSFFLEIDNLIAAQGEKVNALKEKKKGMMQQMFPQKDETTPRLRFPGFTGEWVEKKFKEITYPSGKKNRHNLPYERYSISHEVGFYPQSSQFEDGGGYLKNIDCRQYIIVSPHSFAYNPARINVGSIGYQNLEKDVIVSSLYEVFQTNELCDDLFLWQWFHSDIFHRMVIDVQEGGVRQYFFYEKLRECIIRLPLPAEQKKIAECLSAMDDMIASESAKLDALKDHKKGLMQQLFPQPNK